MNKFILSAALLWAAAAGLAHAEKADSSKPTEIKFDQLEVDDVKQTKTAIGNVILTRGTLQMKSPKAVMKEDPEGYQYVTMTSTPGTPATFRQKRDGEGDQWVEGQADRIEYDGKTELVKLFSNAQIRRLEAGKPSDEVRGEFISYDSRKEFFSVKNTATGESKPGAGRGTMVIQPSNKNLAPAASVPPAGK
ncbi:lipopolysaccharide transport periplasmic protein LptA [Duganella sp. LX20W]|uniref:Lipopolysaccharide export system protein LptA n=1 Tax=Rugamonas brunnea TaxID=2758569 RepID=A0A7W2IBP8_9BURK|nr:lipopolysaccharide transport periplasmic protein LptA [Rugamonas brunnea]MBA5637408.1 lipopolysaccharide transport periplasmic protein LptA [Rugamonas brunnea]